MDSHQACSFCGSNTSTLYFGDERFLQCKVCKIVSLKKSLWATFEQPDYYEDANNYNAAPQDSQYLEIGRKRARNLIKKITPLRSASKSERWLDIGANYGLLVEELNKEGFHAEGIELNKNLVLAAQERGLKIACVDVQNFIKDASEQRIFDFVSAIDVLEHLPKPMEFINNAKLLVKAGGYLIIEVPNIESFLAQKHEAQWKYVDREHIHYFSPSTLKFLLESNGFSVLFQYSTNPFLESFSIRKLLHYYLPRKVEGDRLSRPLKSTFKIDKTEIQKTSQNNKLRSCIRKILVCGIHVLRREDFILIIAKKV